MEQTDLLTERETADVRRCSTRKLQRDRAEGRGCPYVRIDGRIFYRRQDVDRFIAAHVRGLYDAEVANEPAPRRRNRSRKQPGGAAGELSPQELDHSPAVATKPVRP